MADHDQLRRTPSTRARHEHRCSTSSGDPAHSSACSPTSTFHDVDIDLDDATVLVAYTDGISEARRDTELFGEERILEHVARLSDQPIDDVLGQLVDAALEFGGRPNQDDIAAVAFRPTR